MTPIEDQFPYANNFVRGAAPNSAFHDAWEPNPFRLHAPPSVTKPKREHVPVIWARDEAAPSLQRVSDQPLQQYWNQKKEIPVPPALAPAHGVVVPTAYMKAGWAQSFVPTFGRRHAVSGASPALQLSRPIVSKTYQDIGARSPIKGKAPKVR